MSHLKSTIINMRCDFKSELAFLICWGIQCSHCWENWVLMHIALISVVCVPALATCHMGISVVSWSCFLTVACSFCQPVCQQSWETSSAGRYLVSCICWDSIERNASKNFWWCAAVSWPFLGLPPTRGSGEDTGGSGPV